eukprot:TRINITY_DN7613_c0_g1_i1.p1 TRINITY_DN7613_c0_g1~~TRINITY_DN7613_c0_g1_i1.p1  ORF type:complete len:372 (+),score=158.75 TRINITY_DN7613_c0_g1_i1:66-1181(+)
MCIRDSFYTVEDVCKLYGADATRVALSDAGDSLDDANFKLENADGAVLRLYNLEQWIKTALATISTTRATATDPKTAHQDEVFSALIDYTIYNTDQAFEKMRFRDAVRIAFFEFTAYREDYKTFTGTHGFRRDLLLRYVETQLILLNPIAPHITEYSYSHHFLPALQAVDAEKAKTYPHSISQLRLPHVNVKDINYGLVRAHFYLKNTLRNVKLTYEKMKSGGKKGKDAKEVQISLCTVYVAAEYPEWQRNVLSLLAGCQTNANGEIIEDWKAKVKAQVPEDALMKKSLQFGAFVLAEVKVRGHEALEVKLPFDELHILDVCSDELRKEVNVEKIQIFNIKDVKAGENKNVDNAVNATLPGKPQIVFSQIF